MLTNEQNNKIVYFIKTNIGTYGPFQTRQMAESAIMMSQIPFTPGTQPMVVERTEDGKDVLFG